MSSLIKLSATLVALEFLYIMYLETFATASEKTSQVFGMEIEELKRKSVNTLFRNQGIYNGAVWVFASRTAVIILMCYIIAVALYGSVTSNPKIILMQGGLAIVTLCLCLIF